MRVGVCIPIAEIGPQGQALAYAQMRDMARLVESAGLDSIWVADHLIKHADGERDRGYWESLTVLGALAEATRRVELGPLVLCAPFRNPGLIAWAANTLDEISGGRFVLGLGAGWHQPEFDAFGFEFTRRVSVLADALGVIVPLFRDGRVSYEGRFSRGEAELRPPGPRRTGPPILLAGSGPRMLGLIARHADRWNSVWYGLPTDEFRDERRRLEEACVGIGRDPKEIEVSAGIQIVDPAAASENGSESVVGDAEHIADAFRAWEAEGVAEVMCRLEPPSMAVVEEIAEAARQLRG